MRVLFISHDGSSIGGASFALMELIDSLQKKENFEAIVLMPNDTLGLSKELEKKKIKYIVHEYNLWAFVDRDSFIKNSFNYIRLFYWQLKILFSMKSLLKKIEQYDIDLIHSNSSIINIGAWISRYAKKPHIWHIREFGEEHHKFRFIMGKKLTRKLMDRYSDSIITISHILNNKYSEYVRKTKLECIYDGVSMKYDNPIKKLKKSNIFTMIISGTIQHGKGQLDAVNVVIELLDEGFEVKLLIIGKCADENYLNEINRRINKKQVYNEHIKLLGHRNDLNHLRALADVELVCSYMEAFGRITIEAMLSMLPVIASNSGANNELVRENFNGFLYEIKNLTDLKDKIIRLYKDANLRKIMGKNGYEFAKKNFGALNNAEKVYILYNKLLNKKIKTK